MSDLNNYDDDKNAGKLSEPAPDPPTQVAGTKVVPLKPTGRSSIPCRPNPPSGIAFHGLAGELVEIIKPHTEAHEVAILAQFLAMFGNVIGQKPHWMAESDRHALNLFVTLVGESSRARKGTSLAHVRKRFRGVDSGWEGERIATDLSSGEGLIWSVRDPIGAGGDSGADDKRLMICASEYASVLKMASRQGNTLSSVLRQGWDGLTLEVRTKNSPARATNSHISLISHITSPELRRYLTSTEMANGFANRHIWFHVHRTKLLPEGGRLKDEDFASFDRRLLETVQFAKNAGELRRDEQAATIWEEVYPDLTADHPGLLGAILSRAEAQVMRLACLFTLLDHSVVVRPSHLKAALELWWYSESSAAFIFGDSIGDPLADEILRVLRTATEGMTRTDINNYFGRHQSAAQISHALTVLEERGLAFCSREPTVGRTIERWSAVVAAKKAN